MKTKKKTNIGKSAPSNAQKTEDQQDLPVEEPKPEEKLEKTAESPDETPEESKDTSGEPSETLEEPNETGEKAVEEPTDAPNEAIEKSDETSKEVTKDPESEEAQERDEKPRFSGAARKRFKYFLALGLTREEAREKALTPIGPTQPEKGTKRSASGDDKSTKRSKGKEQKGIKICIVHNNFPDELLSPEQLKAVQESIMDQITDMGQESTTKPKFHSSTQRLGWLAIICADETTAEWLKEVTPTLQPWEEASMKALTDDEMPHLETFVAFLPDSQDYSNEKILKLIEAQNDSFNVSTWKVLKRETVGSEVELTFAIDRKFTVELKKADCQVNYKFGHVRLWPKDKKRREDSDDSKNSKSEAGASAWKRVERPKSTSRGYKGPPSRSDWRAAPPKRYRQSGSDWRGSGGGGLKGYRGPRASNSRPGSGNHKPSVWSSSPRGNFNNGQGLSSWSADTWKPWAM